MLAVLKCVPHIKRKLAASVMAAMSVASIGTAVLTVPASASTNTAGRLPFDRSADSVRSRVHLTSGLTSSAQPAAAPRTGPSCDSTFHQAASQNPGGAGNIIFDNALAVVTAGDIWAVGAQVEFSGPGLGPDSTLSEHWDGATWSAIATPNPGVDNNDLWGVTSVPGAIVSTNNVWAVGDSTDGTGLDTLILHYDGAAWTITTSHNQGVYGNTLSGLTTLSSTAAYAVGNWYDINGRSHTLLEQWNGTAWSIIPTPDVSPGTMDNALFSVAAPSANNVWPAGAAQVHGSIPSDTLVEHWDGTQWTIVPSPDGVSGSFNELNAIVAVTSSNIWTAGDYTTASQNQQLTLFANLCN